MRVKELEEELTRVASEQDAFRSWAREATTSGKVLAGQLGAEQSAHELMKGALYEALTVVEASRTETVVWRGKAEGESYSPRFIRFSYVRLLTPWCDAELGREVSRVAEASRVKAQRLKEKAEASWVKARCWELKAKGEFRRLPSLFSLFFPSLNPVPFSMVQSRRRRLPGQPRLPSRCRRCSRPRSGSTRH